MPTRMPPGAALASHGSLAFSPPYARNPMSERYLPTHEWARQDGALVVIGLSAFAAGEVGDVIHVELPKVGAKVAKGTATAEIESVKSVNDFYSPVDGDVVEVNSALADHPELVNQDPTGKGWFAKVKPSKPSPLDGLLSADEYQKQVTK
jgi:glycine cleavage system H protein